MEIIKTAIATDNDLLVSAVLSEAAFMSGADMTDAELEMVRHNWAQKRYPDLSRLDRLRKACGEIERYGPLANSYIDSLTDADLIKKAEQQEKDDSEALAAVKAS